MFQEKGVGIVEVVMILVVLAIFASTAIPSFINRDDASQAAVNGVAGSLTSAAAINYTVRSISSSNGVAIKNCVDVVKALEGTLGKAYVVLATAIPSGVKAECTVVTKTGEQASFVAQGIS